jgi:hypothetical protein
MPTERVPLRRPRRGRLDGDQEMELWLGPSHRGSAFHSEEERQSAWFRHRERLLEWLARHGRRPWGWWRYEAPFKYPGRDLERSRLFRANLLSDAERAMLLEDWRREFELAQQPDFCEVIGPGQILEGDEARRSRYRWADIPTELVTKWTTEHRRRSRRIEALKVVEATPPDEASPPPVVGEPAAGR